MTQIQIQDLRLSFIWVETVLDLLNDPVPSGAPLDYLGRRLSYTEKFNEVNQVLRSRTRLEGLGPPWPRLSGQLFWTYYLEGHKPGNVSGSQAWKALVPLRRKVPAAVEAHWLSGYTILEAFFYPHGHAFVLTVVCRAHCALEEAVEKAFEVRREGRFQIKWGSGEPSEFLSLNPLAHKVLDVVREIALGSEVSPGAQSVTPFTVVTVVRGTGVDPDAPIPDQGDIHRALEAMTTWRPTYRYDALPNLVQASLQIRTAPPSHALYGHTRGRAVWFPALFIQQARGLHSLTCYHRNLVFASLQVESLSSLVFETAKQIREGTPLSATHRECARRAAGILGRLYGGVRSTYRSWSPRSHIEQNGLVTVVNEVRDFFNMAPLS